jgi:hypothetical protein
MSNQTIFTASLIALGSKSKDWLALNQDDMSRWSNKSYSWAVVLVCLHFKYPTKCVGLVQCDHHLNKAMI